MFRELPWYLPVVLGLACGILVWAILCVKEKRG